MNTPLRLLFAFLGLLAGSAVAAESPRPNVLFILADDLGWGDLSCYGNPFLKTPNLDRLAAGGTMFTQFYVNGSVCSPSRCAFFTGQYPARHRIHGHYARKGQNEARGMSHWLEPKTPSVAHAFHDAGYATAHFGKWHLGNDAEGPPISEYGFDFVGSGEGGAGVKKDAPYYRARSTSLFVDEALKFIGEHKGGPFYLQLCTLLPHATLNPTPEQMKPFERFSASNQPHKSARTIYYASVNDLDQQVGRLLDGLKTMGLAEKTIVIFSSDNGPEEIFIGNAGHSGVGSTGPFRGRKRSLYEGGVRVPYLVSWPGHVPAGRIDDTTVVAGVDQLPTLAKLAGIPLPAEHTLDGEDLSAAWLGRAHARTRPLMWEWRFGIFGSVLNMSPQLAIRDGDWKLLMNPDRSRVELYDIPRDPMQVSNLANQHAEVVEQLAAKLLAWRKELPTGPVEPGAGKNDYRWLGKVQANPQRETKARRR
ncbi:MAG: sulfatase-like hydrolase/transferase [Verrucomicrobiota bacterium]|nr:sulfatase-like hydrolase/transferase [Verrucomicrobiota bacterium]